MAEIEREQKPVTAGGEIRKGSGVINDSPVAEIVVPSKSEAKIQANVSNENSK